MKETTAKHRLKDVDSNVKEDDEAAAQAEVEGAAKADPGDDGEEVSLELARVKKHKNTSAQ